MGFSRRASASLRVRRAFPDDSRIAQRDSMRVGTI